MELVIDTPVEQSQQATRRLKAALAEAGCEARISYGRTDSPDGLSFRYVEREGLAPPAALIAVNREGGLPVPVWVTRRTAGVQSLAQLQDRDLALVEGQDPVGSGLPLAALADAGVTWAPGQLYRAGDYGSALSLLLHNNTHAAASELALVRPYLDNQGLAVTWRGEPPRLGGWYPGDAAGPGVPACIEALSGLDRDRHPQAMRAFPEWIHWFRLP